MRDKFDVFKPSGHADDPSDILKLNVYDADSALADPVEGKPILGVAQFGAYTEQQGLCNASFAGWAASQVRCRRAGGTPPTHSPA